MSALPPKADIVHDGGNVRFVPKADISRALHMIIAALGEDQKLECAGADPRGRGELALSCAPTSVPRRHVTDAWYTGPLSENNKRKLSGMLPASTT